jgi:hypothetical protein
MANTHSHSPWRKAILIPFWVLQIFLSLWMIAVFVLEIVVVQNFDPSTDIVVDGKTLDYNDYKPVVKG